LQSSRLGLLGTMSAHAVNRLAHAQKRVAIPGCAPLGESRDECINGVNHLRIGLQRLRAKVGESKVLVNGVGRHVRVEEPAR